MLETPATLLAADEFPPVTVLDEAGGSPFLLVADHAGNRTPAALGLLGLPASEFQRHIAWDIGIAGVCRVMAHALGAILIEQNYSRLVIDCNRPPGVPTSIPELSEHTVVPGNIALSESQKASRRGEIFQPYHERIAFELDRRRDAGRATVLVAMHSFTPVYKGISRPWEVGVMYNRDPRLAQLLLASLKREDGLLVGDNEPYRVTDASDYTIPVHGERRGLPHVAIEVRQDLIADEYGQRKWGLFLARCLSSACRELAADGVDDILQADVAKTMPSHL